MSKIKFLLLIFALLIIKPDITSAQTPCGHITESSGYTYPYDDCQNPFEAIIDSPINITLEDQPLTPNSQITIDALEWGIFYVEEKFRYHVALYKKVGDDYEFQKSIPERNVTSDYDQTQISRLEFKFYYIELGLDTNWNSMWRELPQYMTPEGYQYALAFDHDYSSMAHLFEADGEYMLVLEEFDGPPPMVTWRDKLFDFLIPTAHAQFTNNVYAIPFSINMSGVVPDLRPTCNLSADTDDIDPGDPVTLSWTTRYASDITLEPVQGSAVSNGTLEVSPAVTTTYTLTATGAGGTNECQTTVNVNAPPPLPLAEQAAAWAKTLVDQPDAYLWGGKGWDYDSGEFTSPENILSGYRYYNGKIGKTDMGIGIDCSGLIAWAFNRSFDKTKYFDSNFVQYENADGQFRDHQSDPVTEAELAPGDALFFDWDGDGYMDHTAMYVGESGGYDVVNAGDELSGITSEENDLYKLDKDFAGYRRLHQGDVKTAIQTGSPVDLKVTDPDGFTISPDTIIASEEEYIREVPGELYYTEGAQGHDGNPTDIVYSPHFKTGTYQIEVLPTAEATATSTYSLTFSTPNKEVVIVDNELVSSVPQNGFTVEVTDDAIEIVEINPEQLEKEILAIIAAGDFKKRSIKKLLELKFKLAMKFYNRDKIKIATILLKRVNKTIDKRSDQIDDNTKNRLRDKIDRLINLINA